MGEWHYDRIDKPTGKVIERIAVHFTAEECVIDEQVLAAFGGLEVLVSKGNSIVGNPQIENIQLLIQDLPEKRAEHWLAELTRIGAIKAKAAAAPAAKPAETDKK